jgi:alpha-glucosidase
MPSSFADFAVDQQLDRAGSTLELYREALRARRELQTSETLTWGDHSENVLWFRRENGWNSLTNFGTHTVAAPEGEVILASTPLTPDGVAGESTIWFRA